MNQNIVLKKSIKQQIFQKKIAYISDQQYPIQKADSEQVINTVSALAIEGVNIKLVIPRNWRNLGISKEIRKQKLQEFYHLKDGFSLAELLHLPLSPIRLEKYSHGLIAPSYAKIHHYDIIYTRNPLPALLSLILGLKVIFETYRVYDLFKPKLAARIAKLTKFPNLLAIITHSSLSKESLIKIGAVETKIAVIPNGFNPEIFIAPLSKSQARRLLNLNDKEMIACYAGRLDKEKGIPSLIDLAERNPEITFIFIGKFQKDREDWITKISRVKGLKNIHVIPWIKINELTKYLFASDLLLIPPTAEPMMKYGKTVLPMKLFLYMAAGRPILAPCLPDSEMVLNFKNAALVEPDNLTSAQKCLRRIFEDEAWANSLAEQAKLDSKNYTWQSRAKKIIAFLNERLQELERQA